MNRAEFEADVLREGYGHCEIGIKLSEHRSAHANGFDARLFVLDGCLTLGFGEERCVYGPR